MLNEFYDFISKRIFSFFQVQSDQGTLQQAESFCLKLDDEEMVINVSTSLQTLLSQNNSIGTYKFKCLDGTIYETYTLLAKNIEIIIAAQDSKMTSDFLGATLRNAANEERKPLLMITANPIDSALSGSRNMSSAGMPFYFENLIKEIISMISNSTKLTDVEKEILQFELERREEDVFSDRSSLYEYKELLAIMSSGKINDNLYPGFRLFAIDGKKDFGGQSSSQIRKIIRKNHDLFEQIDRCVRFGNIEVDLSADFDEKFISRLATEKNKNLDQWSKSIKYDEVIAAMEKKQAKKDKPLQIEKDGITAYHDMPLNQYILDSTLFIRNEGSQKAKRRTRSILIFNSDNFNEITLKVKCNIRIPNSGITTDSGVFLEREQNDLIFKFIGEEIAFHRVIIKDETDKITYVFKICILGITANYLIPTIMTSFVIDYKGNKKKCRIKLLAVGTDLSFNQLASNVISKKLGNNETYYCDYQTRLNIFASEEELANYGNGININVSFAGIEVPFVLCPDEAKSQEITGRRIFREKFAAKKSFLITNDTQIQRDSQEYFVKENLQREINLENNIIRNHIFTGVVSKYHEEKSPPIEKMDLLVDDVLKNAYIALLDSFADAETTPTLAYLDDDLLLAANNYLNAFLEQFNTVKDMQPLSMQQQNALLLGTLSVGDNNIEVLMTPFHPLNIAYQLSLAEEVGFDQASDVVIDRLNSIYLLPYIQRSRKVYKVSDQLFSMEWKHYAPVENKKYMGGRKYVPKLVEDKVTEFTGHFRYIFDEINNRIIKINLINMGDCREILQGIAQYYCHAVKKNPDIGKLLKFEVHVYTDNSFGNTFNYLKDRSKLKRFLDDEKLSIASGIAMNNLEDIMAKLIDCYFCSDSGENYTYSHLTFYEMESEITSEIAAMDQIATGVALGGIISGVPSSRYGVKYRTGFGSKYARKTRLEEIAELLNSLSQVNDSGNPYQSGVGISTQIDSSAESKMDQIYESSNWIVFVDPKVDLDFFFEEEAKSDLLIIHYSDQYTSSSGYDAITVTHKSKQYMKVIQEYLLEKGVDAEASEIAKIINLFNAINGDWLLRLVSSKKLVGVSRESTFSREKISIVAAIKLMLAYLKHPDILWVPISMEEMLRVSGGAGLSQREGLLSAKNLGFEKGPTSDDLLFVGIHKEQDTVKIYFYPTEVKTGYNSSNVIAKAFDQAASTAKGLQEALNSTENSIEELTYKVNRNFMMQLVINSCKKMQVYHVDDSQNWNIVLDELREKLLNEDYVISNSIREVIGNGAVLSFKRGLVQRKTSFKEGVINFIEVPETDEYALILAPVGEILENIDNDDSYMMPLFKKNVSGLSGNVNQINISKYEENKEEQEQINQEESIEDTVKNVYNCIEEKILDDIEHSNSQPDKKGIVVQFGKNKLNGDPVLWEPNNTDQIFHTNTGIIGTMGTGKTQFTKSLITQLYREQSKNLDSAPIGILIFDYKGDYNESKSDFVEATNATVLKPYHLPFNPLALTKSSIFKPLLPIHTANAFKDTLAKVYGLGPKQQDTLFQCILDAYHKVGIFENDPESWNEEAPTFETVYQIYSNDEDIKKNDSLAATMNKLHQFQVFEGTVANTKSLFELINGIVVIDVSGYDSDIQSLVIAITLDLFYSQMQAAGSSKFNGIFRQLTKMILVDEADNFMSQGFSALKKIMKEGREFGVGTILSTQFLKHFGSGDDDYAKYILTWVVHNVTDLKQTDVDFVFNTEAKSVEEHKLFNDIKKLQKHNSIVKIGTEKPVYTEDLPFWKLIK